MRFAFTDDQLALRAGAAEVLASACTPADVRAVMESGDPSAGRSALRWAALSDLGATGLLAPVDAGGLGLGEVELVGVLEEAGRVALPEALGIHAGVAVPLLSTLGLTDQLVAAARGTVLVTVGGVDIDPDGPVVTSHHGRATTERVEAVSQSGIFLLATATGDELELHLIARDDAVVERMRTLDPARDLGRVTWDPRPETVVAAGPDAAILIDAIATRSALAAAAQLCGLSEAMLSMTAAYVVDREQFGKPIGSFQAIKHLLADVRVALEFARPAVYRAAWSLDVDEESQHHDAALAKALASDLGTLAATTCLQVHGGIGYTWEHDLQLFMKRAWGLAAAHGDAATQRARALGLGLGL